MGLMDFIMRGTPQVVPVRGFNQSYVALPCKVPVAVTQLQEWLMLSGVKYAKTEDIPLLFAEVLNNIVEHAYQDSHDGEFAIDATLNGPMMIAKVHDWGPPANLHFTGQMPDVDNVDLDDLPEGGFGLALITALADQVAYTRANGRNTITLHKRVFD